MKKVAKAYLKKDHNELGHCIFIDYSKDIVQYMILDSQKAGFLPLSEKLPNESAYINRKSILSCKIKLSEFEKKKKQVPLDVLDFLLQNDNSKVFISKKSKEHVKFENVKFTINNNLLSKQTQSNVLVTLN